jgi:hypothetical protein
MSYPRRDSHVPVWQFEAVDRNGRPIIVEAKGMTRVIGARQAVAKANVDRRHIRDTSGIRIV